MGTINYTILKKELSRDPIELGYSGKTKEEIVSLINEKLFSESALFDKNGVQVFYADGKTSSGSTSASLAISEYFTTKQIKRSRAELLFGYETVITVDDINLTE